MNIRSVLKSKINNALVTSSNKSYEKYAINDKRGSVTSKLSKEQLDQLSTFYRPYFKINPLFHTFYTEKTGKFAVEYIPDDMWFTKIDRHFNDRQKAKVLDHKSFYERFFAGKPVKHPETIIHRINGFWYDASMQMLSYSEVEDIIQREHSLFIKVSSNSCGGRGVQHISNKASILEEFRKAVNHSNDIVVQRAIVQHHALSQVSPNSVNSIRIVSLLSEKNVKIYSSILRMGVGESKVDNASSGGICSGIQADGRLTNSAYTMYGKKFDVHPTTGIKFSDVVIPSYDRAAQLVKTLHPMLPDFRLVSWDIAIDEIGDPVLIEVNLCRGQLDFHQLNNGPIFKEDTEKILTEVFGKSQ